VALFLVHWKAPDQQKFRQAAAKFAEFARNGKDIDDFPSIKVVSRIYAPQSSSGYTLYSAPDLEELQPLLVPWESLYGFHAEIEPVIDDHGMAGYSETVMQSVSHLQTGPT